MPTNPNTTRKNVTLAQSFWGKLSETTVEVLQELSEKHGLRISSGDLVLLNGKWYVTHSGLLDLARRNRCRGIRVEPVWEFCNASTAHWAFKAVVFRSGTCKGFAGFGDANPSNVSPLVQGAEMRMAETRAVNRALRKAYGIGICSAEEIGSFERSAAHESPVRKLPAGSSNCSNGHGSNGNANGNGTRVRDRLCQLIRQHKLDAELVKAYAVDFCGTKTLREASRQQVEAFVVHLADWAEKDCSALLCELNSFHRPQEHAIRPKEGAA